MAKVALLINELAGGGAERVVSILLNNLSREGRQLYLIVLNNKVYYDLAKDVRVISLDSRYLAWPKLKKVIKREGIDTVVSFLGRSNYINILAGGSHQKIISERVSPAAMHKRGLKGFFNRFLVSWLYPKADLILANAQGIKNSLVFDFKVKKEVKVIYNPIELEKIAKMCQNSPEEKQAGFFNNSTVINVARLEKQKNQADLIKAFALVKERIKDANLVILGEGRLKKGLKSLVAGLGLNDSVHFLGWQKNPFPLIGRSRVFVLSSLWEGFPNVLLEAMACRTPVISFDCPTGPNEIIKENSGLLVEPGNINSLAENIAKVLEDDNLADKLAREGEKRVKSFAVSNIIKEYEEIL